jgi:hypothetical protein
MQCEDRYNRCQDVLIIVTNDRYPHFVNVSSNATDAATAVWQMSIDLFS